MNLNDICLTLCREIHKLVPYDRAAINLPDTDEQFAVHAEESRLPAPAIPQGFSTVIGTATGWVMRNTESVICEDILNDDRFPLTHQRYRSVGIRSYIMLPLIAEHELLGVLNLGSLAPKRFGQKELELLTPIADILALAVQNSRRYEESRNREEMQKVLRELSQDIAVLDVDTLLQKLTEKIRDVLKVDVSDVRLIVNGEWRSLGVSGTEPRSLQPTSSGVGRGLSRSVVQSGQPVTISDMTAANASTAQRATRHGFRGYAGVPLLSRNGDVIGVLRVLTYRSRHFSQDEIESLQQLAGGAAIAVENARLFEEVRRKSAELENAFKLKTDFLNTMAHELRTPLNVVIGTQQLLEEGAYGELGDQQQRALSRIGRYARDLLELINEILDLMRLEAKKVPLHPEEFSARDVTDDLELSFEPLAREKGLRLEIAIARGLPRVTTDRLRLREILENLLANAVKYTEAGGIELRVGIQTDGRPKRIVWSVADTGIGIRDSDLPHIFEPFYMAEGVDRRKYPGSGLGLSIVKRLVELLDGNISVESGPGRGSTFTVSLPLCPKTEVSCT
ncbi:MAG TPA: GAF domain-containing sensor histidine kinase [Candidatus Binatia bacterium]